MPAMVRNPVFDRLQHFQGHGGRRLRRLQASATSPGNRENVRRPYCTMPLLVALFTATSCSSSPPPPPADRRPLGAVTAPPTEAECAVLAHQAIARALGVDDFYASGSESAAHFSHCVISKSPAPEDKALMTIELHSPFDSTLDALENTKAGDKGTDLPSHAGPGYSAPIFDTGGNVIGAQARAWTKDVSKVLVIRIVSGKPGRDHKADVVEFVRQLRPLLLS
jgi:hypothetical protein